MKGEGADSFSMDSTRKRKNPATEIESIRLTKAKGGFVGYKHFKPKNGHWRDPDEYVFTDKAAMLKFVETSF